MPTSMYEYIHNIYIYRLRLFCESSIYTLRPVAWMHATQYNRQSCGGGGNDGGEGGGVCKAPS